DVNTRVHRTHGEVIDERFERERPLLLPLRPELRIVERTESRIVSAEGNIAYRGNHYALPAGHRGRSVLVRDDGQRIRIFTGRTLLIEHPLSLGKGRLIGGVPLDGLIQGMIERTIVAQRPLAAYEELI